MDAGRSEIGLVRRRLGRLESLYILFDMAPLCAANQRYSAHDLDDSKNTIYLEMWHFHENMRIL